VKLTEIGRKVPITILRDGKTLRMDVEIGDANTFVESAEQ
jgi:hypothetical protein